MPETALLAAGRKTVFVVDHRIENRRLPGRECVLHSAFDLVWFLDPYRVALQAAAHSSEVDSRQEIHLPPQLALHPILLMKQGAVVEHDDRHAQSVTGADLHLREDAAHEAAVTLEAHNLLVGRGQLGPD